ncbi:wax ester synthase/diacylglycerol acyltransferase 11-like isoform X2 [Silene latifolia]|uniref:wax ester synthase/diacylglycerol acyltransferase 11-like isoform X2 n=1 Tax=Silene latifolia TaxID=37657 RepID=UPI003D7774B1
MLSKKGLSILWLSIPVSLATWKGGQPTGWTRTEVIIDDHVIIPDLDPNTDSPDRFIEDYVSSLTTTPMDLSKPLWELHLLNIKTKEANSIAVFRIHHSAGDGIYLMSIVLACTRQTANPDALPTLPISSNKKKPTMTSRPSCSLGLLSCFFGLMFIFTLLWNTLIDLAKFTATSLWLKDTKTPLKGGPGVGFTPKRYVYRTLSLDNIKLVKKALDVTINDVVLGITQAGISYYLNRKYGELKGEQKAKFDNLPKHIRFRSSVIVNLRPVSTIENLAENMEASTKGKWNCGNAIGYVHLPFHIAIRNDPLDYIRNAKATMDRKKHSLEALCTYKITRIVLKTLGLRAIAALVYRVISHPSLVFSNVVGPKEEISFFGHPIAFIAPSACGLPQALIVHFQSYMDKMTLILAIDQDVIPDPQTLCDDIEESLRLAYKAIIEQNLSVAEPGF